MKYLKLAAIALAIIALGLAVRPANAAGSCWVTPGDSAPVGTTFWISCDGYQPNIITNVYAVEPDGRASGINIYGFFPTSVKTDASGVATFYFATEFDGEFSTAVGHYIFVIHALGLGNTPINEHKVNIDVQSRAENYSGAYLAVVGSSQPSETQDIRTFWGTGYAPFEAVNIWVTSPDGAKCSGLGIDQLTLGALGAGSSSLWSGPNMVKADASGAIGFSITFNGGACAGEYQVTARAPVSGRAAETSLTYIGNRIYETGDVWVKVTPDSVPAFGSSLTIWGGGFHPGEVVNCWFTRPDGRVLSFINVDAKVDASGSFATGAILDDFPPYTSTEPGTWYVTCATANRAHLGIASFNVYALQSDP